MKDSKERKHEIRKVLLNNLVLTEDKKLAVGPDFRITLWGVGDGAGETFFLGVKKKSFVMESGFGNATKTIYKTSECMRDIGRMLDLENVQSDACVLVRHFFFKPVVLVLEEEKIDEEESESNTDNSSNEKELVLSAYSGRALLTGLSIKHAVRQLEKVSDGKIKRFIAPKEA